MTAQDRVGFAELMTGLGETYGEPISEARMEIYFRALDDLELPAVRTAANIHVRTSKFFPRPAELREAIDGSLDDEAERAWMALLQKIRRVGYLGTPSFASDAERRATVELFGGWRALCEKLPGEGPELLGWAKQFKASYRSYARRLEKPSLPPPSDSEIRAVLANVKAFPTRH